MILRPLIVASLALTAISSAFAQSAAEVPVAVVVSIPTPPGAPRAVLEAGIQKAVPQYRAVPGLLRKYFTIGDGTFGGVYLFSSRSAAQSWFGDAWKARVQAIYKAEATIAYFDVPGVLDNAPVPPTTLK